MLDEMPSTLDTRPRSIYLVDLVAGSVRTTRPAPEGWSAWFPAISGRRVAWIEFRDPGYNTSGPVEWRIVVGDVGSGSSFIVASGVQQRTGHAFSAAWPSMDLDGDRVAYAVEDPAHPPDGWVIRVVSVTSGAILRSVRADLPVYDLGLSGEDIAWTEGRIDSTLGFTYEGRLRVLRASDAKPRQIATDAYEVAAEDGRLAWSQDAHTMVTGAAQGTQVWTATFADLAGEPAAPEPGHGAEQYQAWPSTGDGFVTWDSARLDLEDTSVNGDRFCLWDPRTRTAYELAPTPGAVIGNAGGGWFAWVDERQAVPTVSGVPIASTRLP